MRKLFINNIYMAKAYMDDSFLGALAASLCIKAFFVSSTVTNLTQRKLRKILHCNPSKCKKVLGWMIHHNLCEQKVKTDGSYYIIMKKTRTNELFIADGMRASKLKLQITDSKKIKIGKDRASRVYDVTLKNMERILRKLIMVDYFQVRQYCSDCTKRLEEGTFKEKKAAYKNIGKMQKRNGKRLDLDSHKRGTSYEAMSKYMNKSERYMFSLIKEMIEEDKILVKSNKTDLTNAHKTTYDYDKTCGMPLPEYDKNDIKSIFAACSRVYSDLCLKLMAERENYKKNQIGTRTIREFSGIDENGNYCVWTFCFYANEYKLMI